MKQVVQHLKKGSAKLAEVPVPAVGRGQILVAGVCSLISPGTERMVVGFAQAGLVGKARQQPAKVKQAISKAKTDGVMATFDAISRKLDSEVPLGYCHVGVVAAVGEGVEGFAVGDRVASNGPHAEVVAVPATLAAKIPQNVGDEEASFTVIGSIALEAIRESEAQLGESILVIGLGLVGLMAAQLLKAQGCRVLGVDISPDKIALARSLGLDAQVMGDGVDIRHLIQRFSRGRGVDAAIVATATSSNGPVMMAADNCRKKGRVVLVGVAGMQLERDLFYHKQLTFRVSCAYGAGRYDPAYESGKDYPLPYVRWTAGRNMEAVLDVIAAEKLTLTPLISHRYRMADAEQAYQDLLKGGGMGMVIRYDAELAEKLAKDAAARTVTFHRHVPDPEPSAIQSQHVPALGVLGVIGAGNYASAVLIPALKEAGFSLHTVASRQGLSASTAARKFDFVHATSDVESLFAHPHLDTIAIATPHASHAGLVVKALSAGKHVFVEKPLALTHSELDAIEEAFQASQKLPRPPMLMVGYNRRFAPLIAEAERLLTHETAPRAITITVNAGRLPPEHPARSLTEGGRLLGEGCHFVDLAMKLARHPLVEHHAMPLGGEDGGNGKDGAVVSLRFMDGSIASIHYLPNGHPGMAKERVEIFSGGKVVVVDNFRRLYAHGTSNPKVSRLWAQDKGQRACTVAFFDAITSGKPHLVPFEELMASARAAVDVAAPFLNQK